MKRSLANPLDHYEVFLEDAINLTYRYAAKECENMYWNGIPSIDTIEKHLPIHFEQELSLMVISKEAYGDVGAINKDDFLYKLQNGEYKSFVPDRLEIIRYLNTMQLMYTEPYNQYEFEVRNNVVMEVW